MPHRNTQPAKPHDRKSREVESRLLIPIELRICRHDEKLPNLRNRSGRSYALNPPKRWAEYDDCRCPQGTQSSHHPYRQADPYDVPECTKCQRRQDANCSQRDLTRRQDTSDYPLLGPLHQDRSQADIVQCVSKPNGKSSNQKRVKRSAHAHRSR